FFFSFSWRIRFAFSSSLFRVGGRLLPARLMKNWIMRMPEAMPLGLTFLVAMVLAIVCASLVNRSRGGLVETVFTFRTHPFLLAMSGPRLCDVPAPVY